MRTEAVPVTGSRVWIGAGIMVVAVLMGVLSLQALLATGPWLAVSVVTALGLTLLLAAVRSRGRSRFAPTGWGALGVVLTLGTLYGGASTGPTLPMPTPDTARRLARLASNGVDAIVEGKIPVEPTRGLELLVVAGVLGVVLGMDLLALGMGRAGLSGVLLAALFAPAALFYRMPGVGVLLVAGTAFLLLLTLTRPSTTSSGRSAGADALPALGAAALVTALALALAPIASSLPFYGAVRAPGAWGGQGIDGPLRLSTDLDMRSSLAARSDRPLLRYTTENPAVGPLRMYTMTDFDGMQWRRGAEPPRGTLDAADGLLWPQDASTTSAPEDSVEQMSIQVGDLDQDRLPIPTDPRSVEAPGRWLYDPVRDEVIGNRGGTRDLSYVVEISPRDLSAEILEQDTVGRRYVETSPTLELPDSPYLDEITALAQEVTADAGTPYDQALALQMYLRDASQFRYSTRVPDPQTEDAVYDFLNQRTGYCVQFATTMTVMARSLGIPARLAVGFLPGRANPEVTGEFVVSARQSHAWPELFFDEAGWVRFEPTPAVQTGAPPVYADPFGAGPAATPTPTPGSSARASTNPQAQDPGAGGGPGGRVSIGTASMPLTLVLGIAVLVVVALAAAVWTGLARRRRRHAPRPQGPEVAWAALRERLAEADVQWSDATTPRQAAELIRSRYRAVHDTHGTDPGVVAAVDQAENALTGLLTAVESERYAPEPGPWVADDLESMVAAAVAPFAVQAQGAQGAPLTATTAR